MTSKSWVGTPDEAFTDAAAWSPSGAPGSGDTAIILDGVVAVNGLSLENMLIVLGSTAYDPGPEWYGTISYVPPDGEEEAANPSPNPTLELTSVQIGANTVIEAPQVRIATNGTIGATIATHGNVVNEGTIGMPTNTAGLPLVQNLLIDGSAGDFVNYGTINIASGQTSVWSGYVRTPDHIVHPSAGLVNDGAINIYGTLVDASVEMSGTGYVSLNDISNGIGQSATPSLLELDGGFGGLILPSVNVDFNGGHLVFGHASIYDSGTLRDFATNPNNMIQIKDFTLTSDTETDGASTSTVTLKGQGAQWAETLTLTFAKLPTSAGQLYYTKDGSDLDITWHNCPPAPRVPVTTTPPHYPPGYHLS